MNSSGPGLCGSEGEAQSPACACSKEEQKFPCEVAPTPASLLEPAAWGGGGGQAVAPELSCLSKPSLPLPDPSNTTGWAEAGDLASDRKGQEAR